MNGIQMIALKALRKLYAKVFIGELPPYDRGVTDFNQVSELIYDLLVSGKPCMVARFGSTELLALTNYLGVVEKHHSIGKYVQGKQFAWWWEENVKEQMTKWSGFFPSSEENLMKFGNLMLEDMTQVDILGSWLRNEQIMIDEFCLKLQKVTLMALEPYWAKKPWTRVLEGKKVLVIHPFASLIESQYTEKRELLFQDKRVLPSFELKTLQAVQSLGGESDFKDWFEALNWMKARMDATDYDVALIGCGAYGFPLAAHAKRMGKQSVHLGGALQLLFGIRGRRWEDANYGVREWGIANGLYCNLMNEAWVRPSDADRPACADKVEDACYW
jgi:hypothetical protein